MTKDKRAEPGADPQGQDALLVQQIQAGDRQALGRLYIKFRDVLLQRISGKLRGQLAAHREDVVVSTFKSFQRLSPQDEWANLSDCDNLLALLTCIAIRKAIDVFKAEMRAPHESPLLELAVARDAGPCAEVLAQDLYETFVNALAHDLREFAVLHLEGHTNKEIASQRTAAGQPCSERTVERKLALIRQRWQDLAPRVLHA